MRRFLQSFEFRKFDWVLALTVFVLSLIGLAAVYSVDLSRGSTLDLTKNQAVSLVLSIIIFLMASRVHFSFYENTARLTYIFGLLLLVGVLFFGITIRGTTGWFRFAGFSFQPAEFAKVALVLFLAWRTERQARRFDQWQFVSATLALTLAYVGLIMLQPDLGSAIILLGLWFGLLLVTGTKKKYILLLVGVAASVFVISWLFLFKDYQKERIFTFIDPGRDPLGSGYNVTQSIIAIGSGQIMGRGLGFGSQSQLHFLPEAQTDFIFSVIGEELGLIGATIVLLLYMVLIWRILRLARNCRSEFYAYVLVGVVMLFAFQLCINIGASVGILPVTGVTLPFISYGGSSLIMSFLLIGIVESAARSV